MENEENKEVASLQKMQADFYSDFVKAQSELPTFRKDTSGYNYKYMGLDQLLGIARPILNSHGIGILHECSSDIRDGVAVVRVQTVLVHKGGYTYTSLPHEMPVEPKKGLTQAQCIGSAETYARRYSLQAVLGVCAEEDDDGRSGKTYDYNGYQKPQKPVQNTAPASDEMTPDETFEYLLNDVKEAIKKCGSVDELTGVWKTLVPKNISKQMKDKLAVMFAEAKKNIENA